MASILTGTKRLIATVKTMFGGQSEVVTQALKSKKPGTALRAAMHEHKDDPKLVDELLDASSKHGLSGRP
jgi:hypothetical protein